MLQGHWCCMVASISSTVQNGLSTRSRLPTLNHFLRFFFLSNCKEEEEKDDNDNGAIPDKNLQTFAEKARNYRQAPREGNVIGPSLKNTWALLTCVTASQEIALWIASCPRWVYLPALRSHMLLFFYGFCLPFLPPGPSVTGTASPPHHQFKALITNVRSSMSRGCTFYVLLNVCLNTVYLSETWDWGSFRVGVCHVISTNKTDKIRAEHISIIGMVEFHLLSLFS